MANTRLELRMKKDAIAYAQGSPLLLEAYALHRDTTSGDCIAQLKWKNIDRRGVQAVMVDLITYDAFNNQINTVQYQYNGLNAAQGAEFGGKTPIIIHDDRIVRFDVTLRAVSFADNSVWNAENGGVFEPLPEAKNQSLPDELCDQLARDLAKQGCAQAALYDVQTAHDLWQCGCGSWQKEGDPCLKCHIARQKLAAASDAALLQAHLDEYRVEQEKQRIEAEKRAEAERIAREKREEAEKIERKKREAEAARKKAIQKKKNKRIAAVACIVLVLAIAIICAITLYFVPQSKYKSAMALMRSGSYDEARDAFVAMGGYRDSDYRLQQIEANRAFDAGNYDAVGDIYASLPEAYQDHAEDFIHMYNDAVALMDGGKYDEAIAAFTKLGHYSDSSTQISEANYRKAGALAAALDYDGARAIYTALNGYGDSASILAQMDADALYDSGDYAAAYDIYATLDAAYQTHASDYAAMYDAAIGYQAAGQYDEAIAIYNELGNYSDSATLATKTGADKLYAAGSYAEAWDIYAALDEAYHTHDADYSAMYNAADEARASGNYDAAYDGFAALGNYRDAKDKAMRCGVEKAESLYAAENYGEAAEVYTFIGDTDKANECTYRYAAQLAAQGEYLPAAQQYEAIMDYADSRDQHYQMGLQARENDKLADAYAIFVVDPEYRDTQEAIYQTGVSASAEELYEVSVAAFTQVGAYKDAAMKLTMDTYAWGKQLYDNGEYDRSAEVFDSMGEFSDAAARANEARYAAATVQLKDGNYADAKERFTALGGYADSATMVRECDYQSASAIYRNADYAAALEAFTTCKLSGYKDADALMNECRYQLGAASMNDGDYETAAQYFDAAGAYGDSREQAAECRRLIALGLAADYEAQSAYADAYAQYEAAGEAGKLPEMAYQSALCKLTESDYAGAIEWFEKAGYDYADVREQLLNIGEYYYATQQYDLAEAVYAKVVGTGAAAQRLYELGQYYELLGDHAAAGRNYAEAGDYADAVQKVYQCAEIVFSDENWEAARAMYTQISDKMDVDDRIQTCDDEIAAAARDARFAVGNYVEFGAYPQTSSGNDATAIEWLVLARDGNNALLISRYGLDAQPYNVKYTDITWEKSTLRKWLNESFLNAAFSAEEQIAIQSTNVPADRNPEYYTDPGNATTDKVFLLSIDEAKRYFSSNDARACQPTAYAVENGAYSDSGNCWWWLRSPGRNQRDAALVIYFGSVKYLGDDVNSVYACARPALWVNLESGIF